MIRWVTFLFLLPACAPAIWPSSGDFFEEGALVATREEQDALMFSAINASDDERWVYFDFESGEEVADDDPVWDLAFQRFQIQSNGGVSGDGAVEVAIVDQHNLEDVNATPSLAFVQDGDELAFETDGGWYEYDFFSHTLPPRKRVYVVRTAEGNVAALEIISYYNDAGTSGYLSFLWKWLEKGEGAAL